MNRPRLVAASAMPPWPVTNGYALRVHHLLQGLAAEWDIYLLSPSGETDADWPLGSALGKWVRFDAPTRGVLLALQRYAETLTIPWTEMVDRHHPSAALLWPGMEGLVAAARTRVPVVWDRIDAVTLHEWNRTRASRGARARLSALKATLEWARLERRVLQQVDAAIVVGERDARVLRALVPGCRYRVQTIPNGVQIHPLEPESEDDRPTVAFTGVLNYGPNVLGARHLAEEVWPRIQSTVPDARLTIAGRRPSPEVLALADRHGIEVLADVPDIQQVLRKAWVVVAPMLSGAGVKNKVLEAWAVGRPVVLYELAANGLDAHEVCPELIVSGPQDMASIVCSLIADEGERRRWGRIVHEAAEGRSWPGAVAAVSSLLRQVAGGPGAAAECAE